MHRLRFITKAVRFFSEKKIEGFTLLEVMIALSIMVLGVIPLLITHAASIRSFTRSKELTRSTLLAESRMALIEAREFPEEFSDSGEDEQPPYLRWEETVVVVKPEVMAKAEIKASASGRDKRGSVDLITYIVNLELPEEEEEEEE